MTEDETIDERNSMRKPYLKYDIPYDVVKDDPIAMQFWKEQNKKMHEKWDVKPVWLWEEE